MTHFLLSHPDAEHRGILLINPDQGFNKGEKLLARASVGK
jgi:hypothetical protein